MTWEAGRPLTLESIDMWTENVWFEDLKGCGIDHHKDFLQLIFSYVKASLSL